MIAGARLRKAAGDLALCLSFYTRLPAMIGERHLEPKRFARAQWAAPLAGVVVGGIGGLVYTLALALGLPPPAAAALTIASALLTTGCLHEDGLCDTADGFGGGANREAKLSIMRDSRLGTYGAAALVLSVLLRWSALAAVGAPAPVAAALIAAHAASRAVLPVFMRNVPAARPDGLAASAGRVPRSAALAALLIGALALLLLGPLAACLAGLCLLAGLLIVRRLCIRQIGGVTGDVLGLIQQYGEIAILLIATVHAR